MPVRDQAPAPAQGGQRGQEAEVQGPQDPAFGDTNHAAAQAPSRGPEAPARREEPPGRGGVRQDPGAAPEGGQGAQEEEVGLHEGEQEVPIELLNIQVPINASRHECLNDKRFYSLNTLYLA